VNSILDELVALDTNEFLFALRNDHAHPACRTLLFDRLPELSVYMPLQILIEVQRNLLANQMRAVVVALAQAKSVFWDYAPVPLETLRQWEDRGAKKGDAVIAAHLELSSVRYLISENRHFLAELSDLPFQVLTSREALRLLG
jgi:hypothetical protein